VQLSAGHYTSPHELLQHTPRLRPKANEVPEGQFREAHERLRGAGGRRQALAAHRHEVQKGQSLQSCGDKERKASSHGRFRLLVRTRAAGTGRLDADTATPTLDCGEAALATFQDPLQL
jgi:hypothetical protein